MKSPTNQTAAILKEMILSERGVTEQDLRFNGFRARISEIRQLIPLESELIKFTNQFGNASYFTQHSITPENKIIAKEIYEKINK